MKTRIKIPANDVQGILSVARKLQERHNAEGGASPLRVLDWSSITPLIEKVSSLEATLEAMSQERNKLREQRSLRTTELVEIVRSCRDVLAGSYGPADVKQLGTWGFDVLDGKVSTPPSENEMKIKDSAKTNVQQ